MKCAIYVRVSTDEQDMANQTMVLREWAEAREIGIGDSKTIIYWLRKKWIEGRRSLVGAGRTRRWYFTEKYIIRCLWMRPWLCDRESMPRGYFRTIVREEYDKNPWYSCDEAAALLGLKTDDAVQRYIKKGWLQAVKKPGPAWQGTWIIRRDAIEAFLARDPRPTRSEIARANKLASNRRKGRPQKLSTRWLFRCPVCQQDVIVTAHPRLYGSQVRNLFISFYINGPCQHGSYVELEMRGSSVELVEVLKRQEMPE